MAISDILLTDNFATWISATNSLITSVNAQLDSTILAGLTTTSTATLVDAINELNSDKLALTGGTLSGALTIQSTLQVDDSIAVGANLGGDSIITFYDDTNNTPRSLGWIDTSSKWIAEDSAGVNQNLFHAGLTIDLGVLTAVSTNTLLKIKSGTTAENDAYTGGVGELSHDATLKHIRVHDGVTAGGAEVSSGGDLVAANNLSDLADAPTARTNLGLGNMALQNKTAVDITGGTIVGITDLAIADGGTGAGTASGAFTNLKQAASTTATGVVETATQTEVDAGTDTTRYVTPETLTNFSGLGKDLVNLIINGNMRLDQRVGPHVSPTNQDYTLDRWNWVNNTSAVVTISQDTASVPSGEAYSLKIDTTTADTAVAIGDFSFLRYFVEGLDLSKLDLGKSTAKQLTLRFKVRSPKTGVHCVSFRNGVNDRSFVKEYTINVADTWEEKTMTITGDLTGAWLTDTGRGLDIDWTLIAGTNFHTTANTWQAGNFISTVNQVNVLDNVSNNFYLADVELVEGSVTGSQMRPIAEELTMAKRYYHRRSHGESGVAFTTTSVQIGGGFPTPMRVTPAVSLIDTSISTVIGGGSQTSSGSAFVSASRQPDGSMVEINGYTGLTVGHGVITFNTTDYIEYDAEL